MQKHGSQAHLEEILQEIADQPGYSAMVSSSEGFTLEGQLRPAALTGAVSAYQLDVWESFRKAMQENGLGNLQSLYLDGGRLHLSIHPAGGLWFTASEEVVVSMEESSGSLSADLTLFEAILKKVLEDLNQVEGIQGNVVTGREGPIEIQYHGDLPTHALGIVLGQTLTDCDTLFQSMGCLPTRQVVLRGDLVSFSLIPLDKETLLVTILEPNASKDVWQTRLQGAATMLASVFQ
jgi:predicted regulator of Ras-like GTPase activity (Roadblock/LC7/MglB family)